MGRSHRPRTSIERDVVEAEASIGDFAEKNPDVDVTVLRFANVLGPSVRTSHIGLFSLPAVPMILGFDPRYQFVHEDDVVHALEHAVARGVPGVFNVAGDGVLALSEVAGLLGKPYAPILPPWGTGLAAAALRRVGVRIPPEAMNQLRFGRGLDNRRYKVGGLPLPAHEPRGGAEARRAPAAQPGGARRRTSPTATSARWRSSCAGARTCATRATRRGTRSAATSSWSSSACSRLRARSTSRARRGAPSGVVEEQASARAWRRGDRRPPGGAPRRGARAGAAHERSRATGPAAAPPPAPPPVEHYDDLAAEEVIALLGSLEADDLAALREHERDHAAAGGVLAAIDSVLARVRRARLSAGASARCSRRSGSAARP